MYPQKLRQAQPIESKIPMTQCTVPQSNVPWPASTNIWSICQNESINARLSACVSRFIVINDEGRRLRTSSQLWSTTSLQRASI